MAAAGGASAAAVKLLAVVTGANQGIGKEIARALGKSGRYHVVMTARRPDAGAEAVAELAADGADVEVGTLDIASNISTAAFAAWLREKHGNRLHVLINNAGMAYKGDTFGAEEAAHTIDVNFHGTARVTHALLPMLRAEAAVVGPGSDDPPRIINVCSMAGRLSQVSPELQSAFQDPAASYESISALLLRFVADISEEKHRERGWPSSMYGISKLGEIAYTFALATQLDGEGIVVNACCPGYCATSMSSFKGPRSPAEGAATPVWLAMRHGKHDSLTGGFFQDEKLISW